MSSAETPSRGPLLRSKRTRNITTNDDSVKLPATKKRRAAVRSDTFEPLTEASLNEVACRSQPASQHEAKVNGGPVQPVQPIEKSSRAGSQVKELTLRGRGKNDKRSERGVGLLTLATNDQYTISQLPALPDQIRSRPTVSYSCVISPENDYILALTHTDALVWSYNASASTPSARELLSFKLPFPPAITEDPLPLASFTSKSANGEPGIVVVSPKWGKIVYWENLSSATSYNPTQPTNGVQGTIPGMFSGEVVKELVPAEPAGFILSLASGRVAQLTTRDQMGRPAVGVQFMRKSSAGSTRGGIFGSIRNVLVGDRRKGTAIVRPGKAARAQRDIIVATQDGELEFWTNNLLTGNHLNRTVDIKDSVLTGLEPHITQNQLEQPIQLKLVDFHLDTKPSSEVLHRDEGDSVPLVLLVALTSHQQSTYYLVDALVADDSTQIRVVHPITCYHDDVAEDKDFPPRLCIPTASSTAFILFEKALVVVSLSTILESPSSQLLGEKQELPLPFQDCVNYQDNTIYRTINFASEDHDAAPSCVVAIQGFGIARVTSHLPTELALEVQDVVSKVPAKARIEQAVFFGTKLSNPLDLRLSYRNAYSQQDIRQAILLISREIVKSSSKHISKSSSAISDHLQQRARALQDLIEYGLKMYADCLTREDRLLLLWNAEKIAAAQALWKTQENIQSTYPRKDQREMTYMNFALLTMSETRQNYPNPEAGQTDHVRHWLIHSVNAVDRLLVELDDAMNELADFGITDPSVLCDYFLEGVDLWTSALRTAFKFREDNASIYGLGNETYQNGVLLSGYPLNLPPAWTSTTEQYTHARKFISNVCTFLGDWWNFSATQQNGTASHKSKKQPEIPINDETGEPFDTPKKDSLFLLADKLPEQVELSSRIMTEATIQDRMRVEASDASGDDKAHQAGQLDAQLQERIRKSIQKIALFNRDGAIMLAEEQKDTGLLVILNLEHLAELSRKLKTNPGDEKAIMQKIRAVQDHVETYFDRFGNDWAYSHFSSMVERGELGRLIGEGQVDNGRKQRYITWFFETCTKHDKRLGKIAWINNIIGENKYDAACRTLETVADVEEADIWSKRTEICLAKLAGLAALETSASTLNDTKIDKFDCELEYLRIVELLAAHINANLYDAVDDEAAAQLAIELYIPKAIANGKKNQQSRKRLSSSLYKLVTDQIVSLEELVDSFTLLQLDPLDPDLEVDDISGAEYPYALKAIDLAPLSEVSQEQKQVLQKIVWRRLLIKDDWTKLNQTAGKSDDQVKREMQETVLFMTLLDLIKRSEEEKIDIYIPTVDEVMDVGDEKASEDVKDELTKLKKYVEKARLRDHFSGLLKEAKDELRRFQDMEGEAQADDVFGATSDDVRNGKIDGEHA